ncbi:hypothetical protein YC2023_058059 [Brassica napus]
MSCVLFAKRPFIQLKKTLVMKRAQSCLIVYNVIGMFKLVLLVTDDSTEEAKFLIFDNIAYPFLNKTADELAEEVAEDATISYADDASQCSIMKNGNNKRLGVMDDGVVNKRRH